MCRILKIVFFILRLFYKYDPLTLVLFLMYNGRINMLYLPNTYEELISVKHEILNIEQVASTVKHTVVMTCVKKIQYAIYMT